MDEKGENGDDDDDTHKDKKIEREKRSKRENRNSDFHAASKRSSIGLVGHCNIDMASTVQTGRRSVAPSALESCSKSLRKRPSHNLFHEMGSISSGKLCFIEFVLVKNKNKHK